MNYQSAAEDAIGDNGAETADDRDASKKIDQEKYKQIYVIRTTMIPAVQGVMIQVPGVSELGNAQDPETAMTEVHDDNEKVSDPEDNAEKVSIDTDATEPLLVETITIKQVRKDKKQIDLEEEQLSNGQDRSDGVINDVI